MAFRILFVLSLLGLTACQTTYSSDLLGYTTAEYVSENVYDITSQGNGLTPGKTIRDFVMLKSAETALDNGKTHFTIIKGTIANGWNGYVTAGTISATHMEVKIEIGDASLVKSAETDGEKVYDARLLYNKLAPLHKE